MQSHLVVHSWEIYHPGFGILLIPFIVILQYFENHFNYSNLRRLIKMQNISIMFIKCWLRWDEVWAENLKREQLHMKMSTPDTWSGVHQIFFLSIAFPNIWSTPDNFFKLHSFISGVLQISYSPSNFMLSGVLQILMNVIERKNIWCTPDTRKCNWD